MTSWEQQQQQLPPADNVPPAVTVTVEPCGNVSGAASVGSTSNNHDERTHTFRKRRLSLTNRSTNSFDLDEIKSWDSGQAPSPSVAAAQAKHHHASSGGGSASKQPAPAQKKQANETETVVKLPDRPQSPPLKHLHFPNEHNNNFTEGTIQLRQPSHESSSDQPVKAHTFRKRRLSLTSSSNSARDDQSTASGLSFGNPLDESDIVDGQLQQHLQHPLDLHIQTPTSMQPPNYRRRRASDASLSSLDSVTHRPLKSRIVHASELLAHPPPSPAVMPYLYQSSAPPIESPKHASAASQLVPRWKKRHTNHDETTLPFPRHIVGTYSCHGIEPIYEDDYSDPGAAGAAAEVDADRPTTAAKINQDRGGVAFPYANSSRTALFAAYDGHGHGGELISQFALHEIQSRLEKHPDFRRDITKAFKETFLAVDDALTKETIIEPLYAGTTACVVLIRGDTIVVSNAGDSRAVLARNKKDQTNGAAENDELKGNEDGVANPNEDTSKGPEPEPKESQNGNTDQSTPTKKSEEDVPASSSSIAASSPPAEQSPLSPLTPAATEAAGGAAEDDDEDVVLPLPLNVEDYEAIDLSQDQNPDLPEEQARIESMGGHVSPPPEPGLSARVWLDPGHTQIGLAMARSIGDHAVKQVGVIAEPVVTKHQIDASRDEFVIIATDGVWEFLSSDEAVRIVASNLHRGATKACQSLIEAAAARWHDEEGDYRDDITALVIRIQHLWKDRNGTKQKRQQLSPTKEEDSIAGADQS